MKKTCPLASREGMPPGLKMQKPKRKLCKRYDIEGDAHFLTFSCFQNQPFLSRERCCQWLADSLASAQEEGFFDLWAYVFMPNHVHLILWPHEGVAVSRILSRIKIPVTRKASAWVKKNAPSFLKNMEDRRAGKITYRFWQRGGGYDRNLRGTGELFEKIDYIHKNPLRKNLVESTEEWYWSSCRNFTADGEGPIPLKTESMPIRCM